MGDCFGESLFFPTALRAHRLQTRTLAEPPWRYTDDTAQAAVLTRHLVEHGEVVQDALAEAFADEYRRDPRRGYGWNAHDLLKAIGAGEPWQTVSPGAFAGTGSMGNGAAMRVAPLGAFFHDDLDQVVEQARASATPTHANPNAVTGAIAVALAAACFTRGTPDPATVWRTVLDRVDEDLTGAHLERAAALPPQATVQEAAATLGSGHQVCAHDTVPYAIWCALRSPDDLEEALWATASGGGDMDTTCAIVGGILGAAGVSLPRAWLRFWEGLP